MRDRIRAFPVGGTVNPPDPAEDDQHEDDAPPVPGMARTTPEAAAAAEQAAREHRAKSEGADAPAVTEEKLRQLKAKARAEIDARLQDRRKKRKLLRGNASDAHPSL